MLYQRSNREGGLINLPATPVAPRGACNYAPARSFLASARKAGVDFRYKNSGQCQKVRTELTRAVLLAAGTFLIR
jgi:hypothetical protein